MSLINNPTTIDYLRDIIATELNLADDRVNIFNTKFSIPNDQYLFIGVEYKFSKVYASKSRFNSDTNSEDQTINAQEHYAILLFSRNLDALQMKERAVMALGSIYAQQQGDQYGFLIARIAPIQDVSGIEGAAILYRFEIPIIVLTAYENIKTIPWYGTFNGNVTVENGVTQTETFSASLPT